MRERLLADWPLKVLALVLAFSIWAAVTGQDRTLRDFSVPLELDFGTERIAASPTPTAVTVRLEGSRTTVRQLDPLRLAVRLDLQGVPLGEAELPLSRSHLTGVPQGINVALFDPERIRVVVAQRARRELEVEPDLVGDPPAGRALYGFDVDPPTIPVEGPQSAVDAMERLRTAPIPLEGRDGSFTIAVGLVPEDPEVSVIGVDSVAVEVLLDQAAETVVLEKVPVRLPPSAPGAARIRPDRVEVTLIGPPHLLERIGAAHIAVVAEWADDGASGRSARVPVRVEPLYEPTWRRLVRVQAVRPTHVSIRGIDDGE